MGRWPTAAPAPTASAARTRCASTAPTGWPARTWWREGAPPTRCLLCAARPTACPSFWADGEYVGPAAIVQAHRFIFDSRDQAGEARLQVLGEQMGGGRCRPAFNCTLACPREIEITKAIGEAKNAIATGK